MSKNISLQSQRPSPPESPPVDIKPSFTNLNPQLPHTPQSPPLASATNASDTSNTMDNTAIDSVEMQIELLTAESAEVSNKRKRDTDDDGGQEQKKVQIENGTPGIEALHRDVGPPYRLSSTPYPKESIDSTIDLFKLYSLEDIANHVARGGDNPKKMGKTYKKHMRLMKLSGKFDAVKKPENEMGLFGMLNMPDEEWNQSQTLGRNLKNGLGDLARSNLAQAMSMSKGSIPKDRFDPSVLALDTAPSLVTAAVKSVPIAGANRKNPPPGPPSSIATQSRLSKSAAEQARPQRNIKKRVYTDEGYEGYGEGYADDMTEDGAFRVGDEDRQQRRKKDSSTGYHSYAPTAMRHASSYGVGA